MLARENIEGPGTTLEGPRGFFKVMVPDKPKIERLLADLGKVRRILETTFKACPACGHTMIRIEAAFSLCKPVDPNQIDRIIIYTNPAAVYIAGNHNPQNEFQGRFPVPFCVAAVLPYGSVTQAEFAREILEDFRIRGLMEHRSSIYRVGLYLVRFQA